MKIILTKRMHQVFVDSSRPIFTDQIVFYLNLVFKIWLLQLNIKLLLQKYGVDGWSEN